MELAYIQDPGHGWIACSASLVRDLGIAHQISRYSYLDRPSGTAYLEEDCDAGLLIDALRAAGIQYSIREVHCNSDAKLRRLPAFEVTA
jgi:hypothetical protein